MSRLTLQKLQHEISQVRRTGVKVRMGKITSTNPLSVDLGAAGEPYTNVRAVGGATLKVGDKVPVLKYGGDLLVLGGLGNGDGGGGGGPYQPLSPKLSTLATMDVNLANTLAGGNAFDYAAIARILGGESLNWLDAINAGMPGGERLQASSAAQRFAQIESLFGGPQRVAYVEDFGAVGDYDPTTGTGTDDTAAIQAAIDSLTGKGTVVFGPKNYLVGGTNADPVLCRTDRGGNSILAPLDFFGSQTHLRLKGATDADFLPKTKLYFVRTTGSDLAYSSTYGPPSVFGVKTEENGPDPTNHLNIFQTILIEDIHLQLPVDAKIAGIDLELAGRAYLKNVAVQGGLGTTGTPADKPSSKWSFGIRMPGTNNSAEPITCWNCKTDSLYAGFVVDKSHTQLFGCSAYRHVVAMAVRGQYQAYNVNDPHASLWHYIETGHSNYHIGSWDPVNGAIPLPDAGATRATGGTLPTDAFHYLNIALWDIEDSPPSGGDTAQGMGTIAHVYDTNHNLWGRANYHLVQGNVGIPSYSLIKDGGNIFSTSKLGGFLESNVGFLSHSTGFAVPFRQIQPGETQWRIALLSDGSISFADGTHSPDATISYVYPAKVKVTGDFEVTGSIIGTVSPSSFVVNSPGGSSAGVAYRVNNAGTGDWLLAGYNASGDAVDKPRFGAGQFGKLQWGQGGTSAPDVNWYRIAAGRIGSDNGGRFLGQSVGSVLELPAIIGHTLTMWSSFTDANPLWSLNANGVSWGPGGSGALDVRLFRAAQDVLGLDDALQMKEQASAPGTPPAGNVRLYAEDDGSGNQRLVVKWDDGTTSVLRTQGEAGDVLALESD